MSTVKLRDVFYIRDISELCGITDEAIRQWCRSGALRSTIIDRQYHISFQDLSDHFASSRRHLNFLYNAEPDKPMLIELKRKLLHEIKGRQNYANLNDE